jgi:hypothetical protein
MGNSNELNEQNFETMQERTEQTLADIANLQKVEQELHDSLNANITNEEKQKIVIKISEISQMRVNLYAYLQELYAFFQNNVSSSRTTLAEQMMAIDIVENELNDAKRKMQILEDEKYNKLRLVEINTYYGKQYNAHAWLMKSIVIICVPVFILSILKNTGFFPNKITSFIMAFIIIIGIIWIGLQIIDMSNRDNMNYDEYNWYFNKSKAPTDDTPSNPKDPWAMEIPSIVCVGEQCCDKTFSTYNASKNLCLPISK